MKTKYPILLLLFLLPAPCALWAQPCALDVVSGPVTLANTNVTYCSVSIASGAFLVIGGAVTINVTGNVDIEGDVFGYGNGYGSGYAPAGGPGAGGVGSSSGGGGGHGGPGGSGGVDLTHTGAGPGGAANDTPSNPVLMGSSGGGGSAGGAAFILSAPAGSVTINGTIDVNGTGPFAGDGGGGAGGTVNITAQSIVFNGFINALGAPGGLRGNGGGGGGGGLILLCPTLSPLAGNGTPSVQGGLGGAGINPIYTGGGSGSPGVYTACSPSAASPPNDVLYLSENLLQPSQAPVSIFWSTSLYPGHLKLRIYNTAGEWIQTLDDTQVSAPYQNSTSWSGTNWKGDRLASGVYFFLLTNATDTKTARLLLVR
jgi:hypothetical protein